MHDRRGWIAGLRLEEGEATRAGEGAETVMGRSDESMWEFGTVVGRCGDDAVGMESEGSYSSGNTYVSSSCTA